MNKQFKQQKCSALGIPASFLFDDSVVKVNSEGTYIAFKSQVGYYKDIIKEIIYIIYNTINKNNLIEYDNITLLGFKSNFEIQLLYNNMLLKPQYMKQVFSKTLNLPKEYFENKIYKAVEVETKEPNNKKRSIIEVEGTNNFDSGNSSKKRKTTFKEDT
jgi:hypothetical protein